MRGDKPTAGSRGRQAMSSAEMLKTGYAMPRRPIRVVLAQDEEATGREEVANKLTPPAYGFWRESVVRMTIFYSLAVFSKDCGLD